MKVNEKKMKRKWKEQKIAPQNCEPPSVEVFKKIKQKFQRWQKIPIYFDS